MLIASFSAVEDSYRIDLWVFIREENLSENIVDLISWSTEWVNFITGHFFYIYMC